MYHHIHFSVVLRIEPRVSGMLGKPTLQNKLYANSEDGERVVVPNQVVCFELTIHLLNFLHNPCHRQWVIFRPFMPGEAKSWRQYDLPKVPNK